MIFTIIQYVIRLVFLEKNWIYEHLFLFFEVHFVVRTFNKGQEDNEAVKRFITYTFERHVRRNPGQKIVILFDLQGCGVSNLVCWKSFKFNLSLLFSLSSILGSWSHKVYHQLRTGILSRSIRYRFLFPDLFDFFPKCHNTVLLFSLYVNL